MDVLSDVLRVVRLNGAVFFTGDFSAPWALRSRPADKLAQMLVPDAACLALFHIVADGKAWIGVEGKDHFLAEKGDVIIFPRADEHTFSDDPTREASLLDEALLEGEGKIARIEYGGGGEKTMFVCGYLSCEQRYGPLFDALPSVIHVEGGNQGAVHTPGADLDNEVPGHVGALLSSSLTYLINEALTPRPGNDATCARLTELFFVELLRYQIQQAKKQETGWLAALSDPVTGRAIELMHKSPGHPWTVELLAHEAGTSRSVLAERFTQTLKQSPISYLTDWRMRLAQHMLMESDLSLAEIGSQVGYDSEAAFNRAFKREVGEPPATWRKQSAGS